MPDFVFPDFIPVHVDDIREAAAVLQPPQWYQVLPAWQAIGAPQYILSTIKRGIFVEPLLMPTPIFVPSQPLKPAEAASWVAIRDQYLQNGAICRPEQHPKYCVGAFMVPKHDGGHCLVIDMCPINKFFLTTRSHTRSLPGCLMLRIRL